MSIQLFRSVQCVPARFRGPVVTLGNFDGMHLGHQALLKKTVHVAKERQIPSVVISFYPHPGQFFSQNKSFTRLSTIYDKVLGMEACQVDCLVLIRFNQSIAAMSADQFVQTVLHDALQVKQVVIGDDFHFGYKREGDVAFLKSVGEKYHFTVESMPRYDYAGSRVSSSRVREALNQGGLALASALLGHHYTVTAHVQYGDALGRRLGFPTINLRWRGVPPLTGVYTVRVHGIAATPLHGVASSGTRPTVDGTYPLLEVHLFDFDQMIYGI